MGNAMASQYPLIDFCDDAIIFDDGLLQNLHLTKWFGCTTAARPMRAVDSLAMEALGLYGPFGNRAENNKHEGVSSGFKYIF